MKHLLFILFSFQIISSIGQVTLNEMQSSNTSTIADNMGDFDDWIEIHNPTNAAIEIGGLILKDQLDTWIIPSGNSLTLLPPGGYFLLWADDQEAQGIFHTNFKLASGGEFLGLYESDGVTVIDSITIPSMQPNTSLIRCNSGWLSNSSPTPLAENDCTAALDKNTTDLFNITVYNKQLNLNVLQSLENNMTLTIYSMDGKEIITKEIDQDVTTLNLNLLESSIYIINITTQNSIYSKKIVLR